MQTSRQDNAVLLTFNGERSFTMQFIAQPQFDAHIVVWSKDKKD